MTDNHHEELKEEDAMTTTLNDVADPDEPNKTSVETDVKPEIVMVIPHDNRLHEHCCDARGCTAGIMVLVKNAKDKLLAFCQHHYNEREPVLLGQGFVPMKFVRE